MTTTEIVRLEWKLRRLFMDYTKREPYLPICAHALRNECAEKGWIPDTHQLVILLNQKLDYLDHTIRVVERSAVERLGALS